MVRTNPWVLTEGDVSQQLSVLRGASQRPQAGPAESESLLGMETLRTAIRLKQPVRLGFVDSHGNHAHEVLVPLSVTGGRVRVFDPGKEVERVISIHRVMDVELVEGATTDA